MLFCTTFILHSCKDDNYLQPLSRVGAKLASDNVNMCLQWNIVMDNDLVLGGGICLKRESLFRKPKSLQLFTD